MTSMLDVIILFIVGVALGAGIVAFLWLAEIEKSKTPPKEVAVDAWLIAYGHLNCPAGYEEDDIAKEARRWWKAWQAAFVCSEQKKESRK